MKKSSVIGLIVAFSLIVIGIGLIIYSLTSVDFNFDSVRNKMNKLEKQDISESFASVEVDHGFFDFEISKSDNGERYFEYAKIDGIDVKSKIENGVLKITVEDNRSWIDRIGIFWHDNSCIKVYLPQSETGYENLKSSSESGDTIINSGVSFGTINIETASGDVLCKGNAKESLNIRTVSGDIKISDIKGNRIELKATSGDIALKNCEANGIYSKSTSGDIEALDCIGKDNIKLETTSGDVEFGNIDSKKIELFSTSGDIEGTVADGKMFTAETTSGDVNVPKDESTDEVCIAETTSGDITIRVK